MCVMHRLGVGEGGWCVISGALNDSCSMRNWVALPELSAALTLNPSVVLEDRRRAGRAGQDGDLVGAQRVRACSISSFFKR